jgi:probable FeS assembly SUF system protein SufT
MSYEQIELRRDCPAVQIPDGTRITLPAGTSAFLTQSLGGSYTLQVPSYGGLFRVAGQDADALGFEPSATGSGADVKHGPLSEDQVWAVLRDVYDPEIPVNIVDLGLVYDMRILPQADGRSRVELQMTLTAPGCGMGQAISMDARDRIERLPGVADADVRLVWEPQWNPQMISPEGRAKLGMD